MSETTSRRETFEQAARALDYDEDEARLDGRVRTLARHKPVPETGA
jgi:hypothetical protein